MPGPVGIGGNLHNASREVLLLFSSPWGWKMILSRAFFGKLIVESKYQMPSDGFLSLDLALGSFILFWVRKIVVSSFMLSFSHVATLHFILSEINSYVFLYALLFTCRPCKRSRVFIETICKAILVLWWSCVSLVLVSILCSIFWIEVLVSPLKGKKSKNTKEPRKDRYHLSKKIMLFICFILSYGRVIIHDEKLR